jgi:hypothetical protein
MTCWDRNIPGSYVNYGEFGGLGIDGWSLFFFGDGLKKRG